MKVSKVAGPAILFVEVARTLFTDDRISDNAPAYWVGTECEVLDEIELDGECISIFTEGSRRRRPGDVDEECCLLGSRVSYEVHPCTIIDLLSHSSEMKKSSCSNYYCSLFGVS